MQFSEKLDFLMNITQTKNSALALKIKLDASHISRLRRGQRNAVKDEACLKAMACYFAKHCAEDYQRKALEGVLQENISQLDEKKLAHLINQWLLQETKNETKKIEDFISGFASTKSNQPPTIFNYPQNIINKLPEQNMLIYYGTVGKQEAVTHFLSEVLAQKNPQTLLLFSDENTEWMTTDKSFIAKWSLLMMQILLKGNKIKIIHTVSRDLDEMLNAITQWMPLYMSGSIEPYFYPKKRDGIFKRTLFIAPLNAAVVSSSIGNMSNQAANLLFRSADAVRTFEEEFMQYLNLCKPLMRIFTSKHKSAYLDTLLEFEKEQGNSIIMTESLSILTMPHQVALSILSRIKEPEETNEKTEEAHHYHQQRIAFFEKHIQSYSFTEIIRTYDAETIRQGTVKVALSDMLKGGVAYYTPEEYLLHLENILQMLKTYNNFHVLLTNEPSEDSYMLYTREDIGAIVAKTSSPPVVLAINETNMTAAFWDFLRNIIDEKSYKNRDNQASIEELTAYIEKLKTSAELK